MDVLVLTAFVSLTLVVAGVVFLAWSIRQGSHKHSDRLVLLPLQDERPCQLSSANEDEI